MWFQSNLNTVLLFYAVRSSSKIVSVWFGHVPVLLLLDRFRQRPGGKMVSSVVMMGYIKLTSDIMTIMMRPPREAKSTT